MAAVTLPIPVGGTVVDHDFAVIDQDAVAIARYLVGAPIAATHAGRPISHPAAFVRKAAGIDPATARERVTRWFGDRTPPPGSPPVSAIAYALIDGAPFDGYAPDGGPAARGVRDLTRLLIGHGIRDDHEDATCVAYREGRVRTLLRERGVPEALFVAYHAALVAAELAPPLLVDRHAAARAQIRQLEAQGDTLRARLLTTALARAERGY